MQEELEIHPIADCLPPMSGEEYAELRDDIDQNGVIEPIELVDGKVFDGRHRYRASLETGRECPTINRAYTAPELVSRVASLNILRRHMDAGQRAMAVVRLTEWLGSVSATIQTEPAPSADGPTVEDMVGSDPVVPTTKELAEQAGVGTRTIEQAKAAERAGLGDEVLQGKMSAKAAAAKAAGNDPAPGADPKPKPKRLTANESAELTEQNETLLRLNKELREENKELLDQMTAAEAAADPEIREEVLAKLKQVSTLKTRLDSLKNENASHKREIKKLRKDLGLK